MCKENGNIPTGMITHPHFGGVYLRPLVNANGLSVNSREVIQVLRANDKSQKLYDKALRLYRFKRKGRKARRDSTL